MAPSEWSALTLCLCTPLRLVTDVQGALLGLLFSSAAQSTSFKSKGIVVRQQFQLLQFIQKILTEFS